MCTHCKQYELLEAILKAWRFPAHSWFHMKLSSTKPVLRASSGSCSKYWVQLEKLEKTLCGYQLWFCDSELHRRRIKTEEKATVVASYSLAKNWIKAVPKTASTTSAFSSIFILLSHDLVRKICALRARTFPLPYILYIKMIYSEGVSTFKLWPTC